MKVRMGVWVVMYAVTSLVGCVSTEKLSISGAGEEVYESTGYPIRSYVDPAQDSTAAALMDELLEDTLDVQAAVRLALMNNRHLQATYESVGIAQADLVQAGLFENPSADTHIGYPVEEDHSPDLGFSFSMNVLDFFHVPLRKAVSESALQEATLALSREVMMLVADVQQAFYTYQAAVQRKDMIDQVLAASEAAYTAAAQLRAAGNIRLLDLDNEQSFFEQARLEAAYAELTVLQSREHLNQQLGLWGEDADRWFVGARLPVLQDLPETLAQAENQAVDNSLDLAMVAQKLETYAHQKSIVNATALVPRLKAGMDFEREGAWEIGPGVGVALPLFDQGQARKASVEAQIKQMQATYYGMAVDVRAATRSTRQQVISHYQIARHFRDTIVPLSSRISVGTQEQYNAMQIGVFQLLNARQQEINAGKAYIDALLTYWLSRTDYDALINGVMRSAGSVSTPEAGMAASVNRSAEDH